MVAAPDEPEELAGLAVRLGLDTVVLDGYHLDPGAGESIRARGVTVLAISDGPFGAGQDADVALDQNLGAAAGLGRSGTFLAGLDYALFRDQVLEQRRSPTKDAPPRNRSPLRVIAVFGERMHMLPRRSSYPWCWPRADPSRWSR